MTRECREREWRFWEARGILSSLINIDQQTYQSWSWQRPHLGVTSISRKQRTREGILKVVDKGSAYRRGRQHAPSRKPTRTDGAGAPER
jgi:hypothetical protein